MDLDLITEQLNITLHDRGSFDCGVDELNVFLKQHANQNQSKNISTTYVAVVAVSSDLSNNGKIYGYYTLSAGHVQCDQLPEKIKSKLPKYPISIARIGRLAVDKDYKKQGIGGLLLHDALTKVLSIVDKIGIYAVVVDAKNDTAKAFYQNYGFTKLQNSSLTLFLPINTIKAAK